MPYGISLDIGRGPGGPLATAALWLGICPRLASRALQQSPRAHASHPSCFDTASPVVPMRLLPSGRPSRSRVRQQGRGSVTCSVSDRAMMRICTTSTCGRLAQHHPYAYYYYFLIQHRTRITSESDDDTTTQIPWGSKSHAHYSVKRR